MNQVTAIGNAIGAMIETKYSNESIPKKGNPLVAREHKMVKVSQNARPKIKNGHAEIFLTYFFLFESQIIYYLKNIFVAKIARHSNSKFINNFCKSCLRTVYTLTSKNESCWIHHTRPAENYHGNYVGNNSKHCQNSN